MFGRYHTGDETVGESDQVLFEPGAAYRHYHACTMYSILTGRPNPRHADMHRACAEAIDACQEALRPGRSVGEVYDVHARTFDRAGFGDAPARGLRIHHGGDVSAHLDGLADVLDR